MEMLLILCDFLFGKGLSLEDEIQMNFQRERAREEENFEIYE